MSKRRADLRRTPPQDVTSTVNSFTPPQVEDSTGPMRTHMHQATSMINTSSSPSFTRLMGEAQYIHDMLEALDLKG